MDKRKVISAYRNGFITLQECAQILGIDSMQIVGMMQDPDMVDVPRILQKQPANG
jgi:predicted DNA-binding ArsR family transcriptional regulator